MANTRWRRAGKRLVPIAFMLCLSACSRYVTIDDPVLKPFVSMYAVDREQYGMSPLPKHAEVAVDKHGFDAKSQGYDVMLYIYTKATRQVAFRLEGGTYRWVGELEQCEGPREFHTVDGSFNESITISYFHQEHGHREGLDISYRGPDDSLAFRQVPIPKAKELLKQWGCI